MLCFFISVLTIVQNKKKILLYISEVILHQYFKAFESCENFFIDTYFHSGSVIFCVKLFENIIHQ